MNKKISPTLIGAFVVGAASLLVVAVIALGSGRLFRQTRDFVLYFDNSVNGLPATQNPWLLTTARWTWKGR